MKIRIFFLFVFFNLVFTGAIAQLNNQAFYSDSTDLLKEKGVCFFIDHLNFTKNN